MTIADLRLAIAGAPDEAIVVVVTNTLDGSTFNTQGADYIGSIPDLYGGVPFVQIVLSVDLNSTVIPD